MISTLRSYLDRTNIRHLSLAVILRKTCIEIVIASKYQINSSSPRKRTLASHKIMTLNKLFALCRAFKYTTQSQKEPNYTWIGLKCHQPKPRQFTLFFILFSLLLIQS